MSECPCGRGPDFDTCCGPVIEGQRPAETAENLMRSRYTAHVRGERDYLRRTHRPPGGGDGGAGVGSSNLSWTRLEIVDTASGAADDSEGMVEFRAHYRAKSGEIGVHHERSRFRRVEGTWVYVDGDPVAPAPIKGATKAGRNDPCPCGSGRKYKKCCGA